MEKPGSRHLNQMTKLNKRPTMGQLTAVSLTGHSGKDTALIARSARPEPRNHTTQTKGQSSKEVTRIFKNVKVTEETGWGDVPN